MSKLADEFFRFVKVFLCRADATEMMTPEHGERSELGACNGPI